MNPVSFIAFLIIGGLTLGIIAVFVKGFLSSPPRDSKKPRDRAIRIAKVLLVGLLILYGIMEILFTPR
jgi:hypothetical protein